MAIEIATGAALALLLVLGTSAEDPKRRLSREDVFRLVKDAEKRGAVKEARKIRPVDVRPARPGEVVVSVIAGEGKETQSRPAEPGDWVVRNRCPETGNEQYLVKAAKFEGRYELVGPPASPGEWREARPLGKVLRFFLLRPEDGRFVFEAPWGETMVALPGDAIVQDPADANDVYRVAAASFRCTYEVLGP